MKGSVKPYTVTVDNSSHDGKKKKKRSDRRSSSSRSSSKAASTASKPVTKAVTKTTPVVSTVYFTDVNAKHKHAEAVAYVKENRLMAGVGNNKFAPQLDTTRGMLVTVLYKLHGENKNEVNTFSDIEGNVWYKNGANWARENNLVAGIGDNKFGGNDELTREQIVAVLYQYAKLKGYDRTKMKSITSYSDYDKVSTYALPAMRWAEANGIFDGVFKDNIQPQKAMTRGDLAQMMMNFSKIEKK